MFVVEDKIEVWRAHMRRGGRLTTGDVAEREERLRAQITSLVGGGLSEDEAFLVGVKRVSVTDALTRGFAHAHATRLWQQLLQPGDARVETATSLGTRSLWVALALAVGAAIAIKLPVLFGIGIDSPAAERFYPINLSFFTLPFIVAYFAWERPLASSARIRAALIFVVAAAVVNLFPWTAPEPDTLVLTVLHLPIVLWLTVGIAYVGGAWHGSERHMDFVRFTGELAIYFVLIALGGGVLIGATMGLFNAIGLDMEPHVQSWIVPCGAAGATVVATWLVESKQSVMENLAPMLTRVFSPLFALLFLGFVLTMVATGRGIDPAREILILFDAMLVLVFGLLLYSISARDALVAPGLPDWIQLTLVSTALVVDVLALWAIGTRISDFGFTPNRVAALGMNLILLANLAGSVMLYVGFMRGRLPFARLTHWQTTYLYVIAGWAAIVAFVFPLLFGFE